MPGIKRTETLDISTNTNRSVDPMNLIDEFNGNTTTGKIVTPDNKGKNLWNI